MNINRTAADLAQPAAGTTQTNRNQKVDRDAFMTLLVAQLKHQDPLAPQDGTQFVAQLAQFNSLDQLIQINSRLGEVLGK